MRPGLSFYTNMPTPYQLDFIGELKNHFDLDVVYFTDRENDRSWQLPSSGVGYRSRVLKNSWIARLLQKKIVSFHFSWSIFRILFSSVSPFVLVNGTYWSPNVVLVLLISRLRRKKVIYLGEIVFPDNSRIAGIFKKYVLMLPLRIASNAIFAIGNAAAASYRNKGYTKPILNVPYNIDMQLFDQQNVNRDKIEKIRSGIAGRDGFIFLSSGALIARKGMDTIIRAFMKLDPSYNAQLVILGDGPEKENYQRLTGGDLRVHLPGFVDKKDVPGYFLAADAFVFASSYDGWGLVINEAVAADLPIVSSRETAAANEIIDDGKNGFLCDAGDVLCFQQKMEIFLSDKSLRSAMSIQKDEIKQLLSSKHNAQKVYEFCQSIK